MCDRILGGLYIGGYDAFIREGDIKEKYNISRIISVFKGSLPSDYYERFDVKSIEIDDDLSTNILQYFDETNDYINKALFPDEVDTFIRKVKKSHKSSLIIICQAGESRSATILASFLMKKYGLNVEQAVHAISRKRERVRINEYFMEQLELYYDMGCVLDETHQGYRQWKLQHSLKYDPTGHEIIANDTNFIDDTKEEVKKDEESIQLRCKKCRQQLATSSSFLYHEPPSQDSKQSAFIRRVPNKRKVISFELASSTCSHYFFEPLNWMKSELQKSELEGKLNCPKCESKIGGYNWKGSRCSCGKWMVPAIYLQKAKTDALKIK